MKKILTLMSAVSIAFLLSGCAGMSAPFSSYTEPQDGERARLRVMGPGQIRLVPDSACIDWSLPRSGVVSNPRFSLTSSGLLGQTLGMPKSRHNVSADDAAEVYISAGKPIIIWALMESSENSCTLAATFIPEANMDYEALTIYRDGKCSLQLTPLGNTQTRLQVQRAKECEKPSWFMTGEPPVVD